QTPLSTYKAYPNPTNNFINVAFEAETLVPQATLLMSNQVGQVVYRQDLSVQAGLNVKRLDFDLPSGVYHLQLRMDGASFVETVLIK
ncbi:MAG: T9SS type A sorting domain-containing protein, partial [Bacteroidota bacterium]